MPDPNQLIFEDSLLPKVTNWVVNNKLVSAALALGTILILVGLFLFSGVFESSQVEVLESSVQESESPNKIFVEIAGAVVKPGVYELLASDRVERLLIIAGGLSAGADRAWVEKNINRAAKIVDGQKLYIPKEGEVLQSTGSTKSAAGILGLTITGLVNINTAVQSELESLKGIGPARALAIIENRPYATIDELVSKKVLGQKVFGEIKEQITAP